MRKYFCQAALALALCITSSCLSTFESELDGIELRISKLEEKCRTLNTQAASLRELVSSLEKYDFISVVETLRDNGVTTGYRINFTNSSPITLYNGTNAETPIIGVAMGDDGVYYWTVSYPSSPDPVFITDNYGVRIPTSAASPEFRIEGGNWMVTYDGGDIWHNLGKATGSDGVSFFESVENRGDYVLFKLLNGTEIKIPTQAGFEKLQDACRLTNESLKSFTELASKLNGELYASDIVPILSGKDTIGQRLLLSDGSSYAFYNGTATNAPVIGASRDTTNASDTTFYWTIRYHGQKNWNWILDEDGHRIEAAGAGGKSVNLTILPYGGGGKYYWALSYGGGEAEFLLCNGEKVEASGQAADGIVTKILSMYDNRIFIMATIEDPWSSKDYAYVPLKTAITVSFEAPVVNGSLAMNGSETLSFVCTVKEANGNFDLLPVAADGFYAHAERNDDTKWTITVVSPDDFASPSTSRLDIIVSDGKGTMKTVIVNILHI